MGARVLKIDGGGFSCDRPCRMASQGERDEMRMDTLGEASGWHPAGPAW